MWPKSERRTVLLWGNRWWVDGQPVVFGDLHRAAEVLVGFLGETAKPLRLRLLYQPGSMVAASTDCPKADRETLRLALSDRFPTLADPDLAWSHEPIFGVNAPFSTVLHCEMQAGLFALVAALHDHGIEVESAWPLAAALNYVPEDWPDGGALAVIAVTEDRAHIYRHTAAGRREVEAAAGAEAAVAALRAVTAALGRTDTAVYLIGCETAVARVAAQLPAAEVPRVRLKAWSRLAAAIEPLPSTHPAQLLPAESRWARHRLLLASAGLAALVAFTVLGDALRVEWRRHEAIIADRREASALGADLSDRRATAAEIAALRTAVAAGEPAGAVFAPWLRGLARKIPANVVLTELVADRDRVALAGGVTGPVPDTPWRVWTETVGGSASAWRFVAEPRVPTTAFRLNATKP